MPAFLESLSNRILARKFTGIKLNEWRILLLNIIADEIEGIAAFQNAEVPAWVQAIQNRIHFAKILGLPITGAGSIGVSAGFLKDTLPAGSRLKLSRALTIFVGNAHKILRALDYKSGQAEASIEHGLWISKCLGGAIAGSILEVVALDLRIPFRSEAAAGLLNQSFPNSAPHSFWEKLQAQISGNSDVAIQVMEYHLGRESPFDALRVLRSMTSEPEGSVIHLVRQALLESSIQESRYWETRVCEALEGTPEWLLEKMRREAVSFAEFRKVIDLLGASQSS